MKKFAKAYWSALRVQVVEDTRAVGMMGFLLSILMGYLGGSFLLWVLAAVQMAIFAAVFAGLPSKEATDGV
mgnify:CR=1 FL=1|tara:strand:+ start:269 stop:481 length:213 start_codon:yes stop_codon:yes gene_type:complete